jgi:hypothetical protein
MCSVPALSRARSLVALGRAALATVVDSGLLRVNVPPTLGGDRAGTLPLSPWLGAGLTGAMGRATDTSQAHSPCLAAA